MNMTFLELCKQRYSSRNYQDKPIAREKLDYVLSCAQLAPSAVNFQPWQFLIIEQPEGREKLQETYHRDWFKTAPCYIVILADYQQSWKRKVDEVDFAQVDAAIAIEHLALAATEQGLATCWVCNFEPQLLRENFNLPDHLDPVAILPIGYAADAIKEGEKNRKPLTEIIKWEKL